MPKGMRKLYGPVTGPTGEVDARALGRRLREIEDSVDESTRKAREFPENQGRRVKGVKVAYDGVAASHTITIPTKLGRKAQVMRPVTSTGATLPRYKILQNNAREFKIKVSQTISASLDFWVS